MNHDMTIIFFLYHGPYEGYHSFCVRYISLIIPKHKCMVNASTVTNICQYKSAFTSFSDDALMVSENELGVKAIYTVKNSWPLLIIFSFMVSYTL